jgi:hypothetical protein
MLVDGCAGPDVSGIVKGNLVQFTDFELPRVDVWENVFLFRPLCRPTERARAAPGITC